MQVVVMKNGTIAFEGAVSKLSSKDFAIYTSFIDQANQGHDAYVFCFTYSPAKGI